MSLWNESDGKVCAAYVIGDRGRFEFPKAVFQLYLPLSIGGFSTTPTSQSLDQNVSPLQDAAGHTRFPSIAIPIGSNFPAIRRSVARATSSPLADW